MFGFFKKNKKPKVFLQELFSKKIALEELDRITKLLVRRDFELTQIREKKQNDLEELDKIAKLLVRRDLELSQTKIWLENALRKSDQHRLALEAEKNKIEAVLTSLLDGLIVIDENAKIIFINPQIETWFNLSADDLLGQTIAQAATHSIIGPIFKEIKKEPEKGSLRKELALEKPQKKMIQLITAPVVDRHGRILGLVIDLHDISREKLIERMKTEFVSVTAHQLRTPLSAIKWTFKMLLEGDLGKINKEQATVIEEGYQSNERMISLINDLLNVARLEEGRFLYNFELLSIEEIIKNVLVSIRPLEDKRKIKLIFQKPGQALPKTEIDLEKIQLVLQNLLDNAINYTLPGGSVTISAKADKMFIEIAVADTGVGIPKNQQSRIFDKFFRADNAIKLQTDGSGLGLFIAKNIVEKHGGKIWFESQEGQGTTFYFTIALNQNK